MSSSLNNENAKRNMMQQLLAAVGSQPAEDTAQTEAAEYNWHQPHYFSGVQLKKLDDFTRKVATTLVEKFATLCHSDFNVTITSTAEHFAHELLDRVAGSEQNDYYLAFGTDQDGPCGLISIPSQTATAWVTQLLGDSESEEDASRDLSQLEESLLLDIASAFVHVLSEYHRSYDFHPAKAIVREELPLELTGSEELYKISFNVKKVDSEDSFEADLLILCEKLEPAVETPAQAARVFSAEDISKAVLSRLQQMSVPITAQLASTMLTFEQIMNLQVDDILLLGKRIDEPVELIVEGRTLFHGQPAKSAGKHAVVITEYSHDAAQNTSPITDT